MSGERRDPMGMLGRATLRFASMGYRVAVALRNRWYDKGAIERCKSDVPVISVGNITTGGTGKTPIVAFLAGYFRDQGIRVSIISRGYGRGDRDENDEAAELHQRLPDVPHIQNPDRVEAARVAAEELETQLILMDDGFQHRRLHRDLDLVLIDMTCPFGYGYVLPRGLLREPIASLSRGDVAILTRCDQVDEEAISIVVRTIRACNPTIEILRSVHSPIHLLHHPDRQSPVGDLNQRRVALISGIGNPAAFRHSVEQMGATVIAEKRLSDHAEFDAAQMQELIQWAQSLSDVEQLVCTQKDLVKIQTDRIGGKPLAALIIAAKLDSSPKFEAMLTEISNAAMENTAPFDETTTA